MKLALRELDELWREAWTLYNRHRPGQGRDDRGVKAMLLMDLLRISSEKNRLLLPTDAKNLALMEPRQAGIQIQRLTFDEQLQRGCEELENNEGLWRSEGLNPEDYPGNAKNIHREELARYRSP